MAQPPDSQTPPPRQPWLWMDVSTSARARSGQMNGTLRVEHRIATALRERIGPQLGFCRYEPLRQDYVPVAAVPDLGAKPVAAAKPKAARATMLSSIKPLGKKLERAVRTSVRGAVAPLLQKMAGGEGLPPPGPAAGHEVLLLAGENWSRVDYAAVARMRRARGTRIAAVCQDFIPVVAPQFFADGEFVTQFEAYAQFLIRECDMVISISDSTSADVRAYAQRHGGLRGAIEVVHLGADLATPATARRPAALGDGQAQRFVLSVSTIQSRKNFDLLYHLWRRLTEQGTPRLPTLVIVGQPGFGSADLLWQIAHDPVTASSILHLPRAGDEELAWLYRNCAFTLYPSFYEGWGLPVSESLAFGKYCLASNTSSLPEAGAGLAGHLDPLDFAAWRDAVLDLIHSPEQLAGYEAAIRSNYRPVTWAQSAGRMVEVLRSVAAAPAGFTS
ncbi:Glycosyl transferase, group 1 [Rhodopseudomonas palustris HaA2]|uniref:Glycosyl transferase, group 1 n=1 Tax=Rhodopseudomonas palustris (strain HaA2) TaxID=316058 RepID=Q2ITC8_RHOP2|nr:glycosyltransferase family 1 protein [Rhodopseudomonas palustris]ABD08532.1 Glycosyl transferase, group 1 [Rhodopseudomonas palustris HaA2]